MALGDELGQHLLLQRRRLAVHQVARGHEAGQQPLGYGEVARAQAGKQCLVERADIERALPGIETLQRRERPAAVAELAGIVVLDDPRA
jgi:hypothetical protein